MHASFASGGREPPLPLPLLPDRLTPRRGPWRVRFAVQDRAASAIRAQTPGAGNAVIKKAIKQQLKAVPYVNSDAYDTAMQGSDPPCGFRAVAHKPNNGDEVKVSVRGSQWVHAPTCISARKTTGKAAASHSDIRQTIDDHGGKASAVTLQAAADRAGIGAPCRPLATVPPLHYRAALSLPYRPFTTLPPLHYRAALWPFYYRAAPLLPCRSFATVPPLHYRAALSLPCRPFTTLPPLYSLRRSGQSSPRWLTICSRTT